MAEAKRNGVSSRSRTFWDSYPKVGKEVLQYGSNNGNNGGMETRITAIETRLDSVEGSLSNIEEEMKEVKKGITSLQSSAFKAFAALIAIIIAAFTLQTTWLALNDAKNWETTQKALERSTDASIKAEALKAVQEYKDSQQR